MQQRIPVCGSQLDMQHFFSHFYLLALQIKVNSEYHKVLVKEQNFKYVFLGVKHLNHHKGMQKTNQLHELPIKEKLRALNILIICNKNLLFCSM